MFGVAAQVATALRRLNATGRTPITPVPAHKLNVFGKAVESGCLFFGDTMVERHALSAQARSSPCDGHHPGGSPACSGLPSEHGVIYTRVGLGLILARTRTRTLTGREHGAI